MTELVRKLISWSKSNLSFNSALSELLPLNKVKSSLSCKFAQSIWCGELACESYLEICTHFLVDRVGRTLNECNVSYLAPVDVQADLNIDVIVFAITIVVHVKNLDLRGEFLSCFVRCVNQIVQTLC